MKPKHFFVLVFVLIGVSAVFFLFYQGKFTDDNKKAPLAPTEVVARLHLHPLASPEKIAEAERQVVTSWEEWIAARTEIDVAKIVLEWSELPTTVENLLKMNRNANRKIAAYFQAPQMPPPKTAAPMTSEDYVEAKKRELAQRYYQGPQTPEALIAKFGKKYLEKYPKSTDWNDHYPAAEWLQTLINKGVTFKEFQDYSYYMGLRRNLIRLKDEPTQWRSGNWGIPITTNFEAYKDGYIDRKIWEDRIREKVRRDYPNETMVTVFFPSHHPDKYLPTIGKTTFVRRSKGGSMSTWGTMLTDEQKDNLLYKGIEPEDIEIVYIDGEYNILSEKPTPFNPEKWLEDHSYITEFDGIQITSENYEEVLGEKMPDQWQKWYEEKHGQDPSGAVPAYHDKNALRTAARDAALQTQEQFQQGLRELEKFANMSDTEIQAELERRLIPQLPELPTDADIENRLWSEVQSAQMTPARFEAALKILEQYGPEEGMQRLSKADPKAAAQVQRIIGLPPDTERPPAEQPAPEPQHRRVPTETNR